MAEKARNMPKPTSSREELQREREHIETLFADRINFYLVFAAGVLIFLLDKEHPPQITKFALITVIAVSVVMLVALLRTLLLVKMTLDELCLYPDAPYTRYHERLKNRLPNANYLLFALPIALTIFFCYALKSVW